MPPAYSLPLSEPCLPGPRTSLILMAFGFMIERFSLFIFMLSPEKSEPFHRNLSFWVGLAFILLGTVTAGTAISQYHAVLRSLKSVEIPQNYRVNTGLSPTSLLRFWVFFS